MSSENQKRMGGIGEMLVCADLLSRGHDVFRAINQHCHCDLVAIKDGLISRVEVRSVKVNSEGRIYPTLVNTDDCDLYAFVTPDGRIEYMTPAEAWAMRDARKPLRPMPSMTRCKALGHDE